MATMNQISPKRTLKDYLIVGLKGFCMGASDVVPGVSGGTMALIMGIYEELLNSIKSVDLTVIKLGLTLKIKQALDLIPWQFLLALFTGIMLAIFSLAQGLEWLLENQPVYLWSFFFGLVLASVWMVSKRMESWNATTIGVMALATIGAFVLVGMVPAQTPETWWFIILSGAIAICAMILPGISGSFILVLLGKYEYILSAVNNRDFITLGIFAIGAAIGLATFARVLSWLFKRYPNVTIALLSGLMLGSLRKIWPWKETVDIVLDTHGEPYFIEQVNVLPPALNLEVAIAVGLAIAGFSIVLSLEYLATGKSKEAQNTPEK